MKRCVRCDSPDAVTRAGFVQGRQRFFCKTCDYHFTDPKPATATNGRKRTPITISDVAKAVGVAASTVSRALNGHVDISSTTQQVIMDVAR